MSIKQQAAESTNSLPPPGKASDSNGVVKIADVCGGEACIERTRIPVWILHRLRQLGATDQEILDQYPDLSARDVERAWEYVASHQVEIEQAVRRNGN